MKVLQQQISNDWITARCDETVRYKFRAVTHDMKYWILGNVSDTDGAISNFGNLTFVLIRYLLVDVEGLEDENNADYKLEFVKERIGGARREVVTVDCMNRIPQALLTDMGTDLLMIFNELNDQVKEELNFTSHSATDTAAEIHPVTDATENQQTVQ